MTRAPSIPNKHNTTTQRMNILQHVYSSPELRKRVMRKGSLHPASASTQYLNIVRNSVDFWISGVTFKVTVSPAG